MGEEGMKLDRVPFALRGSVGSLPLLWGPPGEILPVVSWLAGRLEKDGKNTRGSLLRGLGKRRGPASFGSSMP